MTMSGNDEYTDHDMQADDWLENVAMWYVANFDDLDEKGWIGRIGRSIGGGGRNVPGRGRGGDVDPLGGRDIEDVIDRNRDGWVFSGRWKRRAATVKPADEKPADKKPFRRGLEILPSRRRRSAAPKKSSTPKKTDAIASMSVGQQAGLDLVSPRYRDVLGRVIKRYEDEQLITPGNHGERHVAMLERMDASESRAAAKQVIAKRIDEIDSRIEFLNRSLDKRSANRASKSRALDEMMSLLKEREWALHRQGHLASLPDERPSDKRIPVPAALLRGGTNDFRYREIRGLVAAALNSEKPDRSNARYLRRIRDGYEGQAGTTERVSSVQDALDQVNDDLERIRERWSPEASAGDAALAESVAAKMALRLSLERDLDDANDKLNRRRTRAQFTNRDGVVQFKPIDIGKTDGWIPPSDLQGLDVEDVFRQQLGPDFDAPLPFPYGMQEQRVKEELELDQVDSRIKTFQSVQVKLEAKLRETGELSLADREQYRTALRLLDTLRERRNNIVANHMRWEGAVDGALGRDRDGSPLDDSMIGRIVGGAEDAGELAVNQRDVDDWDEVSLSADETITNEAKELLEGKVITWQESLAGEPERTGVVTRVDSFDSLDPDQIADSYDEYGDSTTVPGGDIWVWVTHENGKKIDKPYRYPITAFGGQAEADLSTARIHGDAQGR
jgi:hypothetical protein